MFVWTDEGEYRKLEEVSSIKPLLKGNKLEGVFAKFQGEDAVKISGMSAYSMLLHAIRNSIAGSPVDPKDIRTMEQGFGALHEAQDLAHQTPQFGPPINTVSNKSANDKEHNTNGAKRKRVIKDPEFNSKRSKISADIRWAKHRGDPIEKIAELEAKKAELLARHNATQ